MKKQLKQIREFNNAFEVVQRMTPGLQPIQTAIQRTGLIDEELQEFTQAYVDQDLVEVADALVDMTYLILGAVHEYGLQDCFEEMFNEVHRTNMAKLHDGKIVKNKNNKIMKPAGWTGPDLESIINKYKNKGNEF